MPFCDKHLSDIPDITEEKVVEMITAMKSKSCSLDPISVSVLKECKFASCIMKIMNSSSSRVMPESLK